MSIHSKQTILRISAICFAAIFIFALVLLFPRREASKVKILSSNETIDEKELISINQLLSNELSNIEETKSLDASIEKFMRRWEIKGSSLAVIRDGKLVYSKGYGWADQEQNVKMDVGNIFRLASLSKLVTAAAIMKMKDDSLLTLQDKVFGDGGILDCPQFSRITDKRIRNITVDQLLRHEAGFTMYRGDPLFTTREIMIWEKLDTVPNMDRVIEYALTQRLGYAPGTGYRYSNLGYLILTKIIEVKSGIPYEEYCQSQLLKRAGCYDMHLARNMYTDKYPNEVRYYETHDAEPVLAYNNSGDSLSRRYGGTNVEGLLGAGAWVASPSEFVRFVAAIDGDDKIQDVISQESSTEMTSYDKYHHPIGWVRAGESYGRVRTGTLAGTSAVVKSLPDGTIWMFITNTSSWKGSKFTKYIEGMYRKASSKIQWPDRDLFEIQ